MSSTNSKYITSTIEIYAEPNKSNPGWLCCRWSWGSEWLPTYQCLQRANSLWLSDRSHIKRQRIWHNLQGADVFGVSSCDRPDPWIMSSRLSVCKQQHCNQAACNNKKLDSICSGSESACYVHITLNFSSKPVPLSNVVFLTTPFRINNRAQNCSKFVSVTTFTLLYLRHVMPIYVPCFWYRLLFNLLSFHDWHSITQCHSYTF